jgi:anti-sigma regulatory factor (Ser/Thr protein kinase)
MRTCWAPARWGEFATALVSVGSLSENKLPTFKLPNSASLKNVRPFFVGNSFFSRRRGATIEFHPRWCHLEPHALAMAAAWGAEQLDAGIQIKVKNQNRAKYAARMKLFEHLHVPFPFDIQEHEEAGRFVPITQVRDSASVRSVIADISALLHLQEDPETLAAVQYCLSELLRNVLEHSESRNGAFVCAQNFRTGTPPRVTIAVADCGIGIPQHLRRAHPHASEHDSEAIALALQPGVTGALPGVYGTPDNAGAGLFITRCIAKGSGGYFFVASGRGAYRLRRARNPDEQAALFEDPLDDRHDLWDFAHAWKGTVVALEIRTDQIADFEGYFSWIRRHFSARRSARRRIKFT